MVSSYFSLQDQNKAEICPRIHTDTQPRHWAIYYSQQKKKKWLANIIFYTDNLSKISTAISGTGEVLRTSDFGDVYCARNTKWHYTKSRMFWEDLDISERDKELKFVF